MEELLAVDRCCNNRKQFDYNNINLPIKFFGVTVAVFPLETFVSAVDC